MWQWDKRRSHSAGHLCDACRPISINQDFLSLPCASVTWATGLSAGSWGSSSRLEKVQAAFLGWPDPISSRVGGAPRSGVCINLEARNKDERDPGEKGFLRISIYNTSAPPTGGSTFSTEAPLCVLGSLSPGTFHRVCSWGNEEFRVGDWMHGDCCVSVCLCVERLEDAAGMGLGS